MLLRTCGPLCVKTRTCLQLVRAQSTFSAFLAEHCRPGVVLKSASCDIFQNLAFEDWIHAHVDVEKRSILFMCRNRPAVVIGRHQNPWQECNVPLARERGIPVARRRSGGGTVFHDLGNVNLTFFSSRKRYDRQRNLRIVTRALRQLSPNLDVHATERFDILLNKQFKISGTAAKLGRTGAYHHCTLLCSADRALLSATLRSACAAGIRSNATPSVAAPVRNLRDEDPTLNCDAVMEAVASQYYADFGLSAPAVVVDPTDELSHPGIRRITQELQAWDWVFGKTPAFSLDTSFEVQCEACDTKVNLTVGVKSGAIETCSIESPQDWLPPAMCRELSGLMVGSRFRPSDMAVIFTAFLRANPQSHELENKMHILCEKVVALM
ncbi:lipoyl amidotransferase LIPT1, mitochondrial [Scleropages formosus]|uniref:lipoyl amidotransferase LIPT1, mitochondrial n=1 Tax=Scleropages formosus TaxID=113540 RepID=UPI0010FA8B92|nr:lipoyltransferase 1, mitochondrial [Scleropages formosus]